MSPFSIPCFRHLFAAQITSLIGTGLTTVALSLLAFDLAGHDAGSMLGSILALKMVAYILIAPVAGGMTHLLPRRTLLVMLDVIRATIVVCLPFVDQIWQVFILVFVINAASAAFTPVFQTVIADILDDKNTYTKGLSYTRIAYDLEILASPVLAAAFLTVSSFDRLFIVNSITFLLSALLIRTTIIPQAAPGDHRSGFYDNTLFGVVSYLKTPRLRGLLAVYFSVSCVGAMIIVNTVVLTRDWLSGSEMLTTLFLVCAGAGSMLAAFMLPRLIDIVGERSLMISSITASACIMLCGSALSFAGFRGTFIYAVLWMIAGAGTTFAQTPGGRLVQRSAGIGDRPAFFAANFALSHGSWLLAYSLLGWLGGLLGLSAAFLASGGFALLWAFLSLRLWPRSDPLEIRHSHPGFQHDHPHGHQDPHHAHTHDADIDEDSSRQHSHRHYHPPVTHKHHFVIDRHHTRWPVETGQQV